MLHLTFDQPAVFSDPPHSYDSNASVVRRFVFAAIRCGAYWVLHELRGAAPKRSIWRTATFETIRCAFLKIAVRIEELKTRIKMALPSAYPHVQALTALATSIAARAP
jgi:hypothetical protein